MQPSSLSRQVELIIEILTLAEHEGEDLSLNDVLDFLLKRRGDLSDLIRQLLELYSEYPPRIIIALMRKDPSWRSAVYEASRIWINYKLIY